MCRSFWYLVVADSESEPAVLEALEGGGTDEGDGSGAGGESEGEGESEAGGVGNGGGVNGRNGKGPCPRSSYMWRSRMACLES